MRGEFLKASGARLFAVAAIFASGLANLKLYGHFFTPDVYGIMVVALQLIGYLPMLDGGFRMATNRRLLAADPGQRQSLILFSQEIYSWLLAAGLFVGAILMAGYSLLRRSDIGGTDTSLLFLTLGACGAFSMFANAQANLLLGLGAQATMSVINGISALLGVGALAAALITGWDLWAFPFSVLISGIATYGLALIFLRLRGVSLPLLRFSLDTPFRRIFEDIRRDAWPAFRSQLAILLVFSSDLIIASFFCASAELAIYAIVSRVLGIGRGFLQVFNESAWPFVAAQGKGIDRLQDIIIRANSWIYGLSAGGLVVLLPEFVSWYMGPQWEPSATICWLFVLRFLVIGAAGPASYFLFGKGDFHSVARCTEQELLLSIILSLILGPVFGIAGIATAYLVGTSGGTLLPFWIAYARVQSLPLGRLLLGVWLRATAGFAVGCLTGNLLKDVLSFVIPVAS
jgi:Membrane protein involved in the export of O-antigen and teichoic acid